MAKPCKLRGLVIVPSPGRCVPVGGVAWRVHSWASTVRYVSYLSGLQTIGGAMIYIDNLDFFNAEERLTVVDIVSEASIVVLGHS